MQHISPVGYAKTVHIIYKPDKISRKSNSYDTKVEERKKNDKLILNEWMDFKIKGKWKMDTHLYLPFILNRFYTRWVLE